VFVELRNGKPSKRPHVLDMLVERLMNIAAAGGCTQPAPGARCARNTCWRRLRNFTWRPNAEHQAAGRTSRATPIKAGQQDDPSGLDATRLKIGEPVLQVVSTTPDHQGDHHAQEVDHQQRTAPFGAHAAVRGGRYFPRAGRVGGGHWSQAGPPTLRIL